MGQVGYLLEQVSCQILTKASASSFIGTFRDFPPPLEILYAYNEQQYCSYISYFAGMILIVVCDFTLYNTMYAADTGWHKKREHLKTQTKIEEIQEKNILTEIEPLQLAF